MAKSDSGQVRGPGGPGTQKPGGKARKDLEKASLPVLQRLTAVPKWLLVVAMASALFAGLVMPPQLPVTRAIGGILLLIVALFLGWLLALAWPVLGTGSRFIRSVIIVVVVLIAIMKFSGNF